jgi:hypothetical protein
MIEDEDEVVILSPNEDDETVFQTEEERRKLEREILGQDDEDSTMEFDMETTLRLALDSLPYWKRVFG